MQRVGYGLSSARKRSVAVYILWRCCAVDELLGECPAMCKLHEIRQSLDLDRKAQITLFGTSSNQLED
jgi:hypothetical protein